MMYKIENVCERWKIWIEDLIFLLYQGGGLCCFTFLPDLPPGVTSGYAKFGKLGLVELDRGYTKANRLHGSGIPGKTNYRIFS